jgi:tRNA pseudouridine38-40 synthase
MTHTYRMVVEYDGAKWSGWQEQHNAKTIGGELRRAFESAGVVVEDLGGAGRTDAGVHAVGQTAHLRTNAPFDIEAVARRVRAALPESIALVELRAAAPRFHARHQAVARGYAYRIVRRKSALERRRAWCVEAPIDLERLRAAAAMCVGERDWKAFMHAPAKAETTKVAIARCVVEDLGSVVVVRVEADHFLWRMVRRLVGALVRVGTGELPLAEFAKLIEAPSGAPQAGAVADWTAPAWGLYLERVLYPGDEATPIVGDVRVR